MAAKRRQFSDNDKATALAALDANGGNVLKTAKEIGIARKTLEGWSKERGVHADVADLRHEKRAELLDLFRDEIYAIFAALPVKRPDATYAQLATAAGIFSDKVLLLDGKATVRTEATAKVEHTLDEPTTDRLASIAAILVEVGAFPAADAGDAADPEAEQVHSTGTVTETGSVSTP